MLNAAADRDEDELSNRAFDTLRSFLHKETGIALGDHKKSLVASRVRKRIKALKLPLLDDYVEYLQGNEDAELGQFVNAMTTNLTSFMREAHHFETLAEILARSTNSELRIWSAGCSTGEEPYSITITIADSQRKPSSVKVLATDIDTDVLATAARGVYEAERVEGLEPRQLRDYFLKGTGSNAGKVRVKDRMRGFIEFQQRNLLAQWPSERLFDVIFCRNVAIYFDKETQRRLVERFWERLVPGGTLFLGHSESLFGAEVPFETTSRTTYVKAG